ncbi:MAG: 50S ribosomal protein L23 [Candidatus Levybacteria bacterium]|nr:50S ribosomal protein L23 [Candidatus Levybacteria bacterium]
MQTVDVIIRPLLSEKSMKESEKGRYAFLVHRRANKHDVKRAVGEIFHVDVVSVLTTTVKGRTKRVGMRRLEVKQSPFKKAVVMLKKGQTLGGSTEEVKETGVKANEKKNEPRRVALPSLLSGVFGKGKKTKDQGESEEK